MRKITRARLFAAAATVIAGGALIAGPAASALASPPPAACRLSANQVLTAGRDGTLCIGQQYSVTMQADGNLVEYGNGRALWSSHTQGNPGAYATMQLDSNFVIRTKQGKSIWSTHTSVGPSTYGFFSVGADGNVAVSDVNHNGKIVWQNGAPGSDTLSGKSDLYEGTYLHAGAARLTMQSDGNLVSTVSGKPVWSARSNGNSGVVAVVQQDGNFVVRTVTGKVLLASNTAGTGPDNRLVLLPTGQVELLKGASVLWKAP